MMKLFYLMLLPLLILSSCNQLICLEGINKKPMYGKVPKCQEQLDLDIQFLSECEEQFKTRKEASIQHSKWAWNHFYENNYDTAIMRFNQAWLLDSLNTDVYWGYGNIAGLRGDFSESLIYLEKSLTLDSRNARVWESASTSYGQQFFKTKDKNLLNKSIECLKKSISLDSTNPRVFGQLAAAYSYFYQKDSARKYLVIADNLDSSVVNPELRILLKE